jgi:hypothetical protein
MGISRQDYFNDIKFRLSLLVTNVKIGGKLNLLDLNVLSENFYAYLLNLVYGWELENMNAQQQNVEAIDLIDIKNKIIAQVSSTISKQKVEKSLNKPLLAKYPGYTFKFVGIAENIDSLKNARIFSNPYNLAFNPQKDCCDVAVILGAINEKSVKDIKIIHDFICNEICMPPVQEKVESNLVKIIVMIADVDLEEVYPPETIPFNIDNKISFNKLNKSKTVINDYKQYYVCIDKIYTEFDSAGSNKSLSVLNKLRRIYIKNKDIKDADECFSIIVEDVISHVKQSSNDPLLSSDELEMYVEIIAVDAFIRCKIFENPEAYNVASR